MEHFNIVWKFIIYLLFLTKFVKCDKNVPGNNEQLPYCGGSDTRDTSHSLLFVSTLDGRLSAIDIGNGTLEWSVPTNPGPLLSSSIHNFEMAHNFQSVRLIPSLNGNLYKFDGEDIEPISVTADDLLSSSYKFPEELVTNLVISGGKDTRSYAVSARNGRVMYECSINGCKDTTDFNNDLDQYSGPYEIEKEHIPELDDMIIIRRETQTVRAVDLLRGSERWNFSVGTHELELVKSNNCHNRPHSEKEKAFLDLELKVILSEGIVCAVNKRTPNVVLWQYQFDHPIVNAWKNVKDDLVKLNLFSYKHLPFSANDSPNLDGLTPEVYVAMYDKQLYIQESENMKSIFTMKDRKFLESLKIPWKPYSVPTSEYAMIEGTLTGEDKQETFVTALSVLQGSEYVNGNGYFLYSNVKAKKNLVCDDINATKSNHQRIDDADNRLENDMPLSIVSLWFWWKEIFIISSTTALLLNFLLTRRLSAEREVVIVERHVEIKVPVTPDVPDDDRLPRRSVSESANNDNFVSRFQDDFDMVQCLGKGGFGVVFEVKNKLDDCRYAIKRINLPNGQESRDRVMREVKTLAHCEHRNIVRYFQAWVETPPAGWQENEDKIWMDRQALSHSIDIDSPSEFSPPAPKFDGTNAVVSEVVSPNQLNSWILNLNTNECINFDDDDLNRKTSFKAESENTDTDSFIQFREYTNSEEPFSQSKSSSKSVSIDDDATGIDDTNDSFPIVFKEPTQSSVSATNSKSYSIEFKERSTTGRKQRTYSVNDEYLNSLRKDTGGSFNSKAIESVDTSANDNKLVPFRKTHRRPMSLDLSNRRNVPFFHENKVYLYIQMQLCKKQSLKDWLRLNSLEMRQQQIVPIFKQIVDGVEYCHLKGLIHRDLKPSNIFFSLDGQIKIGDFGLVTDMSDTTNAPNSPSGDANGSSPKRVKHTEQVGTHLYMSPEQVARERYNYKVDIYSLGLIFFELLVVFCTEMERIKTLTSLRESEFPADFHLSFPDEYKLLKLMLSKSPLKRPTTIGIRSHAPLSEPTSSEWHFDLPPRRRDSHASICLTNSSSSDIPPINS
ncbi:Eukaryotic translation initiation factor 2-alpha kinase [Pseudolycoriella hygida]|uniref:non-specific serine/threonine protein kinase n=1 Tax=Pseudolycoriella hygida TaxID=35572 RepID=A0A9Q0MQ19_9DIPT|nr:Eukaryotic translation initiation factor 2-alpha kinase [Pseudolycoriella hygida]